ncbi:hypothetical protein AMK15_19305 [Streptomyces sp. MJM1172]|nr:hypothetical protein AMK15_19305 [Streptomyces sp. MJM1172]
MHTVGLLAFSTVAMPGPGEGAASLVPTVAMVEAAMVQNTSRERIARLTVTLQVWKSDDSSAEYSSMIVFLSSAKRVL